MTDSYARLLASAALSKSGGGLKLSDIQPMLIQTLNEAKAYTDSQVKKYADTPLYLTGSGTMQEIKPSLSTKSKTLTVLPVLLFKDSMPMTSDGILKVDNIYNVNQYLTGVAPDKDIYLRFEYSIKNIKVFETTIILPVGTSSQYFINKITANILTQNIPYVPNDIVSLETYGWTTAITNTVNFVFGNTTSTSSVIRKVILP